MNKFTKITLASTMIFSTMLSTPIVKAEDQGETVVQTQTTVALKQEKNYFTYDASLEGYTSRFSNVFTPNFYIYAGNKSEQEVLDLMDELGILPYVQEWAGKVQVINPLNGTNYGIEDADQFIELLGAAVSNAKVIGIDEGATFVNNYISQECYAVAGMMVVGGEMNEGLSYNVAVPTYLVNPTSTSLDYYVKANGATKQNETTYVSNKDELQKVVVGKETNLKEAFKNAWETIFSRNYRQHNETTEFYMTSASTHKDPYLLIDIPNYEELGMNYYEHYNEPIAGEGKYTWFEYVSNTSLTSASQSVPLVISLHGNGNDARIQGDTTGWVELASEENFIMVSPEWQDQVLDSSTHEPIDNYFKCDGVEKNFEAFMAMLFEKYPQIDKTRVYVTGLSAWGSASALYGVKYQNIFAAAGAVSAPGLDTEELANLIETKNQQTGFMYICGDHDFFGMIPVDGSSTNSMQVAPGVYLQQADPNVGMFSFIQSYQKLNGLNVSETYDMSLNPYYGIALENQQWTTLGVKDTLEGTLSNSVGTVLKLGAIKNQAHWNYKPEARYLWDFFKHYSRVDGVLYIDGKTTKPTETKPEITITPTTKDTTKDTSSSQNKVDAVNTGDTTKILPVLGLVSLSLAGIYLTRKKEN